MMKSVTDAAALAQDYHRDQLIAAERIGEELRKDLILELLNLKPVAFEGPISAPSRQEANKIRSYRQNLRDLSLVLKVGDESSVQERNEPFLRILEDYIARIPKGVSISRYKGSDPPDRQIMDALIGWYTNKQQIDRIDTISTIVSNFNERRERLLIRSKAYLSIVNSFLHDSGKEVFFDDSGYIHYRLEANSEPYPLTTLSSGEAQIFVILTHLAFNPLANEDNVSIIDEPEVSLHVQWQELFIEAALMINPRIQHIMATHSPSIIQDRLNSCIDLSRSIRRRSN